MNFMLAIFYISALAGSCSIGYGLLRVGFPETQAFTPLKKIGLGYVFGTIVFAPAILLTLFFEDKSFFLFGGIIFALALVVLYAKRTYGDSHDLTPLVAAETKQVALPRKITALDEAQKARANEYASQAPRHSMAPGQASVAKTQEVFPSQTSAFGETQGSATTQPQSRPSSAATQKTSGNIMDELRKKTTELEEGSDGQKKREALEKLRSFAKQIKETKKVQKSNEDGLEVKESAFDSDEELSEVNEEELSKIDEEY